MKHLLLVLLTVFYISTFSSCKKDKSLLDENGLTHDINDFMSQEILEILDSLGMPINTGGNPPSIEGSFYVDPLTLTASNRDNDVVGNVYTSITVSFLDQNNSDLTINVEESYGDTEGDGKGSFIVGDAENFSVFTEISSYNSTRNDSCIIASIFSGNISDEGIEDLYYCLVMLEDYDDPNSYYIEVGDARVFYDQDGLSDRLINNKSGIVINTKYEEESLSGPCEND